MFGKLAEKKFQRLEDRRQDHSFVLVDQRNPTGYSQVMEELSDATGVMEVDRTYSYGLDLIAQDRFDVGSSAWDATFYLYDGHGNVRALADDTGTITDTYDYDAFGTLIEQLVLDISASGLVPVTTDNRDLTTDNQYLYCGEQFDPDLGLYFLRARYMDTDRGRFWSMDVFEGWRNEPLSLHKYLYCEDNPMSFVDPSGQGVRTFFELTIVNVVLNIILSMSTANLVMLNNPTETDGFDWAVVNLASAAGGLASSVPGIGRVIGPFTGVYIGTFLGALKRGCTLKEASDMAFVGGCLTIGLHILPYAIATTFDLGSGGKGAATFVGLEVGGLMLVYDVLAPNFCKAAEKPIKKPTF